MLKKIGRIMKPVGKLAVVDFKKIKEPPSGPPLFRRLSPEKIEKIFASHGFKKERIVEVGSYHYMVVFFVHDLV